MSEWTHERAYYSQSHQNSIWGTDQSSRTSEPSQSLPLGFLTQTPLKHFSKMLKTSSAWILEGSGQTFHQPPLFPYQEPVLQPCPGPSARPLQRSPCSPCLGKRNSLPFLELIVRLPQGIRNPRWRVGEAKVTPQEPVLWGGIGKQAWSRGLRGALTRWEGPRAGHEKSRVSMPRNWTLSWGSTADEFFYGNESLSSEPTVVRLWLAVSGRSSAKAYTEHRLFSPHSRGPEVKTPGLV